MESTEEMIGGIMADRFGKSLPDIADAQRIKPSQLRPWSDLGLTDAQIETLRGAIEEAAEIQIPPEEMAGFGFLTSGRERPIGDLFEIVDSLRTPDAD